MASNRIDLIRDAYKCFHEEDVDKLVEFFDDDIQMTNPITHAIMNGKEAVVQGFQRSLGAIHSIILSEIVEMADTVLVVGHHDFYDRELGRLGEGVSEVYRFTFRGDRIAMLEVTPLDEIPEEVRELLTASDAG